MGYLIFKLILVVIILSISFAGAWFFEPGSFLQVVSKCIPSWCIVFYGSHACMNIGYRMAMTTEHIEEKESLQKDIKRAKEGLKKDGFKQ